MSFVDEFTQQQLSKTLNHQMLEQIQHCHSAVEEMVYHLESLRSTPKVDAIDSQIQRFSTYLTIKQELLSTLQSNSHTTVVQWLTKAKAGSPLLTALLQMYPHQAHQMLQNLVKQTFLGQASLKSFVQENQRLSVGIGALQGLKEEIKKGKTVSRDAVIEADTVSMAIEKGMDSFEASIGLLSRELDAFESRVSGQFTRLLQRGE